MPKPGVARFLHPLSVKSRLSDTRLFSQSGNLDTPLTFCYSVGSYGSGGVMGSQRRTPIEKAIDKAKGQDRYARQTRYHARREQMGLTRIAVWVPTDRLEEFKATAHDMVSAHIGAQPDD